MIDDAARKRLRDRQHQVLSALVAGVVPAGFDSRGSRLTTQVLTNKRLSAALAVAPELAQLPHWRERFARFAVTTAPSCGHLDVERFVGRLADDDTADARQWLLLHEVHAGRRRLAIATVGGRRSLVVGLAGRVWYLRRRQLRSDRVGPGTTPDTR